jgi:hypothetical protein
MKTEDFKATVLSDIATKFKSLSMHKAITTIIQQCEKDARAGKFISGFTDPELLNVLGLKKMLEDKGFIISEHHPMHEHDEYSFTISW